MVGGCEKPSTGEKQMSIGQNWKTILQDRSLCQERSQADLAKAQMTEEAWAIIAAIPQQVYTTGLQGKTEVKVFGWLTHKDVPGTDRDKVDNLYKKRGQKALQREDLMGRALCIFEWCEANDLEMFLRTVDIPLNEDEYDVYVRPKSK